MTTAESANRATGFTLIEVMLVVAVLAILATALTPAVLQQIAQSRIDQTRADEQKLFEAMTGRSDQGTFGFVGDIGRLPQAFTELVQPGGLPLYGTQTTRNVGMGWNGPYANFGASANDAITDAFGRPYVGASSGQIRSAGPDGIAGNSDDIVFPPSPANVTGRIQVSVKTLQGQKVVVDASNVQVKLYYASNGTEAVLTDTAAPFIFENVPIGLHAVVVLTAQGNNWSVVAQDTIASPGAGQTKLVEIWY